jgi:hypothetical protein
MPKRGQISSIWATERTAMETSHLRSRLKAALDDISRLVEFIPETEQASLLCLLEDWKHPERRAALRKTCAVPIEFVADGRSLSGIIKNIGLGGIYISPSEAFYAYPGKTVSLKFSLPKRQIPIQAEGEIVWASREGFGVRLELQGEQIKRYLEEAVTGL